MVPKAFEQDTQTQNGRRHQMNGHSDPIRQAFLTRDIHNMRAKKEAVFDHRKIELITQRLFEQLVGQGRAGQGRAGRDRTGQGRARRDRTEQSKLLFTNMFILLTGLDVFWF